MKSLASLLLMASLAAGCASYSPTADKLSIDVTHSIKGETLALSATVTNHRSSSIVIVDHPDFRYFSIAGRSRKGTRVGHGPDCILPIPPDRTDLKTIRPGGSFTFKDFNTIKRISRNTVEINEVPYLRDYPKIRISDSYLKVTFRYGPGSPLSWLMRLGKARILTAEISVSETFTTP
jgi:hypothetical protein